MLPSLNQNLTYKQCSVESYVSVNKHNCSRHNEQPHFTDWYLLSDNCYNFEIKSLDSPDSKLNYNKQSSHVLQKFHIFMALLLKIKSSGMWHSMAERFLHLQGQAIQVLDWLALQMKELQSFQTTHPTGCHILQDLNELFPNSSHITKQLTHHTTNSSVATVYSSSHTRLHTLQWSPLPISSALGPDMHESPESVSGAWLKDRLPQSWMPHSESGCQ